MFFRPLILLSAFVVQVTAVAVVKAEAPRPTKGFLHPPHVAALLQEDSWMDRSQSDTDAKLGAGSHIRLKGLDESDGLNGRQGVIQEYDQYSGRYVITMTSGGPSKRILPKNVELLELSEINDDP